MIKYKFKQMKLTANTLVMLITIAFLLSSCKSWNKVDPRELWLQNMSIQNVVFYRSLVYDSTYIDLESRENRFELRGLDAGQRFDYFSRIRWEKVLEKYTKQEFIVFVLNRDSVRKHAGIEPPFPQNRDEILKTWILNMDSLEKYSWVLTFP